MISCKGILLFSLILSVAVPNVHAANGTFNFKGEVTNAGCTIEEPNLVYEGFKNIARWTVAESSAFFQGPNISRIDVDCGQITNVPKLRFSAETGKVVGKKRTYLKTTGTASNIGFFIGYANTTLSYDDELFNLKTTDATSGKYYYYLNQYLVGLSPYDESNNGDFEAVLGYELVYN
ncbi:hypothetical protein [Enterobacter genomosp. S]|uniref:hypothetical protein n=1 Tax=Enterobacter genomosp. S TaxID=2364151 RepID=UPI000B0EA963|nr:hypothetical protein [Enterobacter genomosp. S]